MSNFKIKNILPTIVGVVASTIAFTALPSHAGTINGNGVTFAPGTGNVVGDSITRSGNEFTINETFNGTNTIQKNIAVTSGGSGIYSFIVNAVNKSDRAWDTFTFNLGGPNRNRPLYESISSVLLPNTLVNNSNGKLVFSGGTVAIGETAKFLFSLTLPENYNSNFSFSGNPDGPAVAAVPTPAALPAMVAFGAGILRKRRQDKTQAV